MFGGREKYIPALAVLAAIPTDSPEIPPDMVFDVADDDLLNNLETPGERSSAEAVRRRLMLDTSIGKEYEAYVRNLPKEKQHRALERWQRIIREVSARMVYERFKVGNKKGTEERIKKRLEKMLTKPQFGTIAKAAQEHSYTFGTGAGDISRDLILAMIKRESDFDPQKQSGKYKGLMQSSEKEVAARGYSTADFFDIEKNIAAGTGELKDKLGSLGQLGLALMAYNEGEFKLRDQLKGMGDSNRKPAHTIVDMYEHFHVPGKEESAGYKSSEYTFDVIFYEHFIKMLDSKINFAAEHAGIDVDASTATAHLHSAPREHGRALPHTTMTLSDQGVAIRRRTGKRGK